MKFSLQRGDFIACNSSKKAKIFILLAPQSRGEFVVGGADSWTVESKDNSMLPLMGKVGKPQVVVTTKEDQWWIDGVVVSAKDELSIKGCVDAKVSLQDICMVTWLLSYRTGEHHGGCLGVSVDGIGKHAPVAYSLKIKNNLMEHCSKVNSNKKLSLWQ
eukprot:Gb_06959 [translate_table: standard]